MSVRLINGYIFTLSAARAARIAGGWTRTRGWSGVGADRAYFNGVRPASFTGARSAGGLDSGSYQEWPVGPLLPYKEGRKALLGLD